MNVAGPSGDHCPVLHLGFLTVWAKTCRRAARVGRGEVMLRFLPFSAVRSRLVRRGAVPGSDAAAGPSSDTCMRLFS
jgi:hypothetical protein